MRILLLANINSSHTRKWALALKKEGLQVGVISLNPFISNEKWFSGLDYVYYPPKRYNVVVRYPILFRQLKKAIGSFKPDVLHSHFLTNYSFLGCLSGFKPHVATAWGSDVFVFPKQSSWGKQMFLYNLKHADALISTSQAMADEMKKYADRDIEIIPFGIDLTLFKERSNEPLGPDRTIQLSCFKKLEPIYRPEVLIKSFRLLKDKMPGYTFRLTMAGDGSMLGPMKELAKQLGVFESIEFTGWLSPEGVAERLQKTDIAVYLSANESFGVSLIEAMAAGVPMVLTKTPGFTEVMSGIDRVPFVPVDDVEKTAEAIANLIEDHSLYNHLQIKGKARVKSLYDLSENIKQQITLYKDLINKKTN